MGACCVWLLLTSFICSACSGGSGRLVASGGLRDTSMADAGVAGVPACRRGRDTSSVHRCGARGACGSTSYETSSELAPSVAWSLGSLGRLPLLKRGSALPRLLAVGGSLEHGAAYRGPTRGRPWCCGRAGRSPELLASQSHQSRPAGNRRAAPCLTPHNRGDHEISIAREARDARRPAGNRGLYRSHSTRIQHQSPPSPTCTSPRSEVRCTRARR